MDKLNMDEKNKTIASTLASLPATCCDCVISERIIV